MSVCRVSHYVRLVQLPQIPIKTQRIREQESQITYHRWQIKDIGQSDKGDSQENVYHKTTGIRKYAFMGGCHKQEDLGYCGHEILPT